MKNISKTLVNIRTLVVYFENKSERIDYFNDLNIADEFIDNVKTNDASYYYKTNNKSRIIEDISKCKSFHCGGHIVLKCEELNKNSSLGHLIEGVSLREAWDMIYKYSERKFKYTDRTLSNKELKNIRIDLEEKYTYIGEGKRSDFTNSLKHNLGHDKQCINLASQLRNNYSNLDFDKINKVHHLVFSQKNKSLVDELYN